MKQTRINRSSQVEYAPELLMAMGSVYKHRASEPRSTCVSSIHEIAVHNCSESKYVFTDAKAMEVFGRVAKWGTGSFMPSRFKLPFPGFQEGGKGLARALRTQA